MTNESRILIKNGRVLDPANETDAVMDIFIENGEIRETGVNLEHESCVKIIDATDMWVVPGLIDMHVHLRDPGGHHKETIQTGTLAAAAGGFTTICPMANTDPVTDTADAVEYILSTAEREGVVHIVPIGSVTKGLLGQELSAIGEMQATGICAISDDGKAVADAALFKTALYYAAKLELPVLTHAEDHKLTGKGQIGAGPHAKKLGLTGIPNESEEIMISRDIILARATGAHLHICHVSTAEGVVHMRAAKEQGLPITAEACPHHFMLADEDIPDCDTNYKMSPPLRSRKDVEAIKAALKDGTICVIATDHAPHHEDDKNGEFEQAANGIIGLETAVPLCITELVHTDILTPLELIKKLTVNPASILGLDKGTLSIGKMADVTVIDPNMQYSIDKETFLSKSRNTPFHGREVRGKVVYTLVNGKIVYEYKEEGKQDVN
ncbi:MAG: dihydroorotase [Defluviitaleaceae bacterium]|nr:dihydroorotase [Defluviitaleaceae bacterium]